MRGKSLKFWKIEELSEVVEVLEDAFGDTIEKYKSGLTYNDILIRAYAYAIIVMKEIVCLLSNGFPDGALARARRLYEQMVLIDYFESRKKDLDFDELVERYCDPYGRILYSRACISTHAGAMGDYALLGRFNPNGEKIYTGTTDSGFSLPLILATMSFYNITNMVFGNLEIDFPKEHKKIEELLNYYQNTLFVTLEI